MSELLAKGHIWHFRGHLPVGFSSFKLTPKNCKDSVFVEWAHFVAEKAPTTHVLCYVMHSLNPMPHLRSSIPDARTSSQKNPHHLEGKGTTWKLYNLSWETIQLELRNYTTWAEKLYNLSRKAVLSCMIRIGRNSHSLPPSKPLRWGWPVFMECSDVEAELVEIYQHLRIQTICVMESQMNYKCITENKMNFSIWDDK